MPKNVVVRTTGDGTIEITDKTVVGNVVELHVVVRDASGADVTPPAWAGPDGRPGHVRIVNPPTLVPDGSGGFRKDRAGAIREVLRGLLP